MIPYKSRVWVHVEPLMTISLPALRSSSTVWRTYVLREEGKFGVSLWRITCTKNVLSFTYRFGFSFLLLDVHGLCNVTHLQLWQIGTFIDLVYIWTHPSPKFRRYPLPQLRFRGVNRVLVFDLGNRLRSVVIYRKDRNFTLIFLK